MVLIFFLSAQQEPGELLPVRFEPDDGIAHVGMYMVLGLLLRRACLRSGRQLLSGSPGLSTFVIGWAYGVCDELHQAFVPGRTPEIYDVAMDAVGILIGIAAGRLVSLRRGGRIRASDPDQESD
jgi:VanZ family protein